MGTSTNHPSPNKPSWRIVNAILGRPDVPIERQSVEIWKAAAADRESQLERDLGDELLAQACEVANTSTTPIEAVEVFDQSLSSAYAANLTLDIGRRALARAVADNTGATGFASELFAEIVSYYASRDLPSFVGAPGRIATARESISLKRDLKSIARETAINVAQVRVDPGEWRFYVASVLEALQNGESR